MTKKKRRKRSDPCTLLLRRSYLQTLNLFLASFYFCFFGSLREKMKERKKVFL